ncbi:MAG: hypothetical protein ACP5JR_02880 [Thermoplasmata archaeon]
MKEKEKKNRQRKSRKRKDEKFTQLLEECKREMELYENTGIEIPEELWDELEKIEVAIDEENYSDTAAQISALMERLRALKERGIQELMAEIDKIAKFLDSHCIPCEDCTQILRMLEEGRLGDAKKMWLEAKPRVESIVAKLKSTLEDVKSTKGIIEYLSTHRINIEEEKKYMARAEEALVHGKIDECIEILGTIRKRCDEKLENKFNEEIRKIEQMETVMPELKEIVEKSRAEFTNHNYYNAFGILASGWSNLSKIDVGRLKAQISDLKILLTEIKTLSGYLPHLEDAEKELKNQNIEGYLGIISNLKKEVLSVFERDLGRIMSRIQTITQFLSSHGIGIEEIEVKCAEIYNYKNAGEYGKAMLTARITLENAEKSTAEIIKNLTKSLKEIAKVRVAPDLNIAGKIKKIEELLGTNVVDALNLAFALKDELDNAIKNQIEPVENTLLAYENLLNDLHQNDVDVSEPRQLLLKTRSLLANYKFEDAQHGLNELATGVQKVIENTVNAHMPSIQRELRILNNPALSQIADAIETHLKNRDFFSAWNNLKDLKQGMREYSAHILGERIKNTSEIVEEFKKAGIKFAIPEISPADPLGREKLESFISACEDTLREVVSAKIERVKKLAENGEKMGIKVEIDPVLLAKLEEIVGSAPFSRECAETIGRINALLEAGEKKVVEVAMESARKMDALYEINLKLGFKTDKYETRYRLAHERIENGRFYEAWFVATRLIAEIDRELYEKFSSELEYTNRVVSEFSKPDSSTISMKVDLENAKIVLLKKDYLKCHELMQKIQTKFGEFIGGRVKEEMKELEEIVELCVKYRVVPPEYRTIFGTLQSLLAEKKVFDAHLQIKDARDFLNRACKTAYENTRAELQKLIAFGEKVGIKQVEINFSEIDEVFNNDMIVGLEQANKIRERVINSLRENINSEIATTKRQLTLFRERGINCEHQLMMIEDASELVEKGKLEEGYTLALEAKASLATVLEHVILAKLEELNPKIEMLRSQNLAPHDIDTKLEELKRLLNQKEIARAYGVYYSIRTEVENLSAKYISEILENLNKKAQEFEKLGINLEHEKTLLRDAGEKCNQGLIKEAQNILHTVDALISERVRDEVSRKLELAKANTVVIEKEGLDIQHYSNIIQKTTQFLEAGNLGGAVFSTYEFEEIYQKLIDRYLDHIEDLREANQILYELGLPVQNLAEEIDYFEKQMDARRFWEISQRILEWQIYLRGLVRDRLVSEINESMKAWEHLEKLGVKDNRPAQLLKEASALIEEHRYSEARFNIVKAKSLMSEQNMEIFNRAYNEILEEIELCNSAGIDTSQAQRFIENFRAETSAMNFYAAKWNLDNAREVLQKEKEIASKNAINMLSTSLESYSNLFPEEFVTYYKKLEQALELQKQGKYIEATKLAYKTNFEFATVTSEKIRATIEYTRKLIEEFSEKGLDMEIARNILNESIYYFNSSDFISAVQKANEARLAAEDIIKVFIQQRFSYVMNVVKECTAMGIETRKLDEEITKAEKLVAEHKYPEAFFTLNTAHLDGITLLQNTLLQKISEIEKIIHEFLSNGLTIPNEVYLYIERAKYSISYGNFSQAHMDIESAKKMLLDILGTLAADRILAVKKIGDMGISIGCPMKKTLKVYQELTDAITKIDVAKAIELCRNIEPDAWKELYDYIQSIILEINALIKIAEEYRVPHTTITESISQAEMQASWRNYTIAYQILINAKKVLTEIISSTLEAKLQNVKSVLENLTEILATKFDMEELKLCSRDLERGKIEDVHLRIIKIEELINSIRKEHEKKFKEFVDEKFTSGRDRVEILSKLGVDVSILQNILAKVEECRFNKDYLSGAVKMNIFLKNLEKVVEIQFVNARADLEQKFKVAREMEIDLTAKEQRYAEITGKTMNIDEKIHAMEEMFEFKKEIDNLGLASVEKRLEEYLKFNKNLDEEKRLKIDTIKAHLAKKEMIEAYNALRMLV